MSVQVGTWFPDFPGDGEQQPFTLHFMTDTSIPQTIVPVFLIHSLKDPFCENPRCVCQAEQVLKNAVRLRITRGEVNLHASKHFQEQKIIWSQRQSFRSQDHPHRNPIFVRMVVSFLDALL